MDRGDRLAAEGRIVSIVPMGMRLVECAILETGEKDDVLRRPSKRSEKKG